MTFWGSDRVYGPATFLGSLLILACLPGPAAFADDIGDWYLSLGLGANYGARTELEGLDVKVEYDLGLPRVKGGVARRLGERWWVDLSMSQRKTKAEFSFPVSGGPSNDVGANDRYTSASLMLSVSREFVLGPWIKPYVGFGVGPTWLTYRFGVAEPGVPEEDLIINDDTTAAAFQALLGIRFPLTRQLDLGVEYEYWRTPDVNVEDVDGNDVSIDQTIHSGWVNLTYYPGSQRGSAFGRGRETGSPARGFYLTGSAGVNWLHDAETDAFTFDAAAPGVLASIALGHGIGRRWRLEAEYAYQNNTPQVVDFGRFEAERRVDGDMKSSSLGLNLHFDLLPDAAIQPTVGIGGGVSRVGYRVRYPDGTTFVDDSVTAAHFQITAGFNIELSRTLDLHTAWRFWRTDNHEITLADGEEISLSRVTNTVEFGLIYRLGG